MSEIGDTDSTSAPRNAKPKPEGRPVDPGARIVGAMHQLCGLGAILLAFSVAGETDEPVLLDAGVYITLAGIVRQVTESVQDYIAATMGNPSGAETAQ